MYDVVVIGAGPIGSFVAYKLAGRGHRVAVLEQKEKLGEPVCCTGIIGRECAGSFATEDSVILRRINSARLYSPSGRWLRLWRQDTQAYIIDRAAFDKALASRAQSKTAEYVLNSVVKTIEVGDDRVKVEAVGQKEKLIVETRAVVVTTGFGSGLVGRLGLGRIGNFVIGVQAEIETRGIDEIEVFFGQETAPGFFGWLVPISPNRALVGLLSRHSPEHYLSMLISSLSGQGKVVSGEVEFNYGGIPLRPLPRTYGDRLIVVGDAAGQVKPTTGGGIYYGLLCADIAADTLHRALETDALSARGLANYEREWKKKIGRELKVGYWARKLYERLSDRQIDKMFDIIKNRGIDETLLKMEDLSFDWHSEAVLRLVGYRAVSTVLEVMKFPFRLTGK